jgi:hypothetical protein
MNITQYMPSKNVRIGILIFFGLGFAFLAYYLVNRFYSSESKNDLIDVTLVNENQKRNPELYKDSDNDGAYDWEEALWGLDPNNPDSDGDGVLDGRYIIAKQEIDLREQLGEYFQESNLSETQKLGRSALSALIALRESGAEITPETQAKISENILNHISNLTLGEKMYLREEFQLVDDTRENSFAYRDAMKKLFRTYPVATSDLEVLIKGTENPQEYQGRLRSIASKYEKYLSELIVLEVPFLIAGRHTELVNNISQISGATNNLLQEESDELVSLSVLIQLEKIMNQTSNAIIKINSYFEIIQEPNIFE